MQNWIPFFVIVAALAIVLQTMILGALFLQIRRLASRLESIANELHSRVNPILGRIQVMVEDAQPKIASMIVRCRRNHQHGPQAKCSERIGC